MNTKINNQIVNFEFYKAPDGKITKPILVFLHGWQRTYQDFDIVAKDLNRRGWSILLVDLPGFGKSSVPKFGWRIGNYADFLQNLLIRFKLSAPEINQWFPIIIIGHSFGGRVAIKLAAKYPEMVKKIVLISSGGIKHKSFKIIALKYLAKTVKIFLKILRLSKVSESLRQKFSSSDYLEATGIMREVFLNAVNEDLTQDAKKITAPTLIIWGEDDEELPPQDALILQKEIKYSHIEIFENAGHFVFLDNPQKFQNTLIEFVSEA